MIPTFGTDGVRGVANTELTPEFALALGRAAGAVLGRSSTHERGDSVVTALSAATDADSQLPLFLVGQDTRVSSSMLSAALMAGLCSAGVNVGALGVIPTAGVAVLVQELQADAGAVISASHNPALDNGIKFFGAGGRKLSDELELQIVDRLAVELDADAPGHSQAYRPISGGVGHIENYVDHIDRFRHFLAGTVTDPLTGLRCVVDAANGSAFKIGPDVLTAAGADVTAIADKPDGMNINDHCGATAPEALSKAVVKYGADVGFAYDGDADRLIAVDENGNVVDGDQILAICALDMHDKGLLTHNTVVSTVMSNLGMRVFLGEHGIDVVETAVGDRNVLTEMEAHGHVLGGEQSGHIIFGNLSPTGCGILTSLQVAQILMRRQTRLSDLVAKIPKFPQILENVTLSNSDALHALAAQEFWRLVADLKEELADTGRVVVRPSGTEAKLRVMVQATDEATAAAAVDKIVQAAHMLDD